MQSIQAILETVRMTIVEINRGDPLSKIVILLVVILIVIVVAKL